MQRVKYIVKVEQPLALNTVEIPFDFYEDALHAYEEELKKLQYLDTASILEVTEKQIKHCRDGEDSY